MANQPNIVTTATPEEDAQQRAAIDRSLRVPVLFFFTSGLVWLFISLLLGMIASMKLYLPDLFASFPFLTYGRVQPAHLNAFVYGWGFQVGLGTALWIMARLCRISLPRIAMLITAGHLWNIGVAIGVGGILLGYGTSIQFLDFPVGIWPLLLVSYCIIAGYIVMMFKSRRDGHVYISQWYILAACFWFPWSYLTANLLIHHFPSAAVINTSIGGWYGGTLLMLWFVPIGLGVTYYLIPKVVGRPIYSYQLALASFWSLALLGGWVGVQHYMGGPLPAWMSSISGAAMIFMIVPMVFIALNYYNTMKDDIALVNYSPTLRFVFFGVISFVVFILLGAAFSLFRFGKIFQFSHGELGYQMTGLYGFFSMIMFGAIYFIMPRLMGCEWRSGKWIRFHFWFSAYGTGAMLLSLLMAGLFQGQQALMHADEHVLSVEVASGFLVGLSISWLLIILSNMMFFFHVLLMICRLGRRSGEATYIHPHNTEHDLKAAQA
ncbi:MAG: cytochrome c oxidase cbb3-type subunit 1 [Verrucomicrobiales bacterium]|jgi:cytochrome c oxidase cbb3-type subunit 1